MTTVDGRLVVAEAVVASRRLYRVSVDGSPARTMTRDALRGLISGGVQPDALYAAEGDFVGAVPSMHPSVNALSGSCGVVIDHPSMSDRVVKIVVLPDGPMAEIRRHENRYRLDPWRAYVGSSILSINRAQADLFRQLADHGSPSGLPTVHEYREGLMDADSLESLRSVEPELAEVIRPGTPVASWVMERVPDPAPSDRERDVTRRQVLDYLFTEHGMLARDLASDDNWGSRSDGSPVVLDPVVVPVSWMDAGGRNTLHGVRSSLRRARDRDLDRYISTVAPFGQRIQDGEDAVSIGILSTNLAYRHPDPAFDALLGSYLGGNRLPSPAQRSYLGFPHGMRPFMI